MQNDVLDERGQYASGGVDITHNRRVIEPTRQLIDEARLRGVPVIWTRHGFHGATDAGILLPLRPFLRDEGFRVGTWGYEVHDAFEVHAEDWYVDKSRFSSFFATNLELILRGMRTETLLITGVLTNQCVAATARDAFHRDIKPVVVEECVGTTFPDLHDAALKMIAVGFGEVRSLDDTLASLQEFPLAPQHGEAEPAELGETR